MKGRKSIEYITKFFFVRKEKNSVATLQALLPYENLVYIYSSIV